MQFLSYLCVQLLAVSGGCTEIALQSPRTTSPTHWSMWLVVVHVQPKKDASGFSVQEVIGEACQSMGSRLCSRIQCICDGAQSCASLMSFPNESNADRWVDIMDHLLRESMLDYAVWNPRFNFLLFIPGHSHPTSLNLSLLERPQDPGTWCFHLGAPPPFPCNVFLLIKRNISASPYEM